MVAHVLEANAHQNPGRPQHRKPDNADHQRDAHSCRIQPVELLQPFGRTRGGFGCATKDNRVDVAEDANADVGQNDDQKEMMA